MVIVVIGLAIALGGLFLVPAPGPGWIVTFLGLGLLGSEFAPIARALDWLELKGRAVGGWAKGGGIARHPWSKRCSSCLVYAA